MQTNPERPQPATLMVSWAHDPNEGVTTEEWLQQVLSLTTALRRRGVDADVDLYHLNEAGIDWNRWGPSAIRTCDFTLAVVNRAWRERFEGENPPTQGAGAAAEANVLLGLFQQDQHEFRRRLLVALLPGASSDDVPAQLTGQQRFRLNRFDDETLEGLLRLVTRQPQYDRVPLGDPVVLPPASTLLRTIPSDAASSNPDDAHRAPTGTGVPFSELSLPGIPVDGLDAVRTQLAGNPTARWVVGLLATCSEWSGVEMFGIRPRNDNSDQVDFTRYLRLSRGGSGRTFAYLWPRSGQLNPRGRFDSNDALHAVAPTASSVKSSNPDYRVSVRVQDQSSLDDAIVLLREAYERA